MVAGQATLYQTGQQLTKQDGQLKDWNRQLTGLQTAEQQQQQETKQLTALQTQIATQQQATDQARQQAEDLNQELLNHEIVRLVGQLKPGSPCPICGATDHPSPAAVADTTVTEAEVKQAQAVAQQQQDRLTQLTTRQQNLREELTTRQTQQQADVRVFWQSLPATVVVDPMTLPAVAQRLADLTNQQQAALRTLHQQQAAITQAQAQVDQLKKQVTQCEQQLRTAQTTQQEKTRAVDRLTAQLTTQRQQLPATAATLADFKRQEQQLQQQLATDQAAWEAVTQRVKQATDRLTVATTEVKAATAELEKSQQRCQTAADQVQALLSQHFEAVTPETESQVAACLEQLATLPQKRQQVQDFRTQQERVTTTIAELKKRVADQPEPDRAQTQAALQAAAKQVNALQDQRHNQQDQFQRNAETVSALKRQMAQQETALKRSQELTELVDVVNGDGPNSKLGLERYVLQTYLRQILTVGNQRLQQLTNGRYQFLVDDQPATYKKNSGLEINVYDDHVGEQRSVHTLSGGESFIAALALALALGEVIQQTTGSVDVDALFIDEGFGSLDEDALMTALESLETVEGQHRMIGIISHVSELRAQVPNQLQVVSNGNGESKITYQIDEG